jgi:DNA polymerase III sliding clamp (beta) subunit (PCNA family)
MRITVDRADLAMAMSLSSANLTKTGRVSEAEAISVDDVYESVLIEVLGDNSIFVNATNGMVWTRARLHGEAKGLGRVLIKSSQLGSIVSNLDDGPVTFELSKDSASINLTSGSYRAEFGVRNAIEYPTMPDTTADMISVEGPVLKALIQASEFCAYEAVDRPYLQGVNIESVGGSIWAVAANGPSIALTSFSTGQTWKELKILLPVALARHAARMAVLGTIDFGLTKDNMAVFKAEDITVVGKISHVKFPDWRTAKNLPNDLDHAAWGEFDTKKLVRAVNRVLALASRDKAPAMRVEFAGGKLNLSVAASRRSAVERIEPLAGVPANGSRLVNGLILARIAKAITTDRVIVRISDNADQPISLEAVHKKDSKFRNLYYIMPRER